MLANKIIIKKAGIDEAPMLTALSITTFCETFMKDNRREDMDKYIAEEMNLEKITGELNDKNNLFFLAEYDNETIGYVKMQATYTPEELKDKRPMEIERIYVLQQHHDKKIGAALMAYCMAYATSNGYNTIWLGVWEHNYRAVNFYKRWGFELFGSHPFILGDDHQTDVLMKKDL